MIEPTVTDALAPTWFVDSDHPDVIAFARAAAGDLASEAEVAGALFAAVREHIWYDPYVFDLSPEVMRASHVLGSERNWCVPKSTLLAACCRALGIPALLGFADVRNHLSTPKLLAIMGTDVFAWHGYTAILLGGEWRKASPAFNAKLCARFGVAPLDFDGTADALLHAYDGEGHQYMEYLVDHGVFADLPLDRIRGDLDTHYHELEERFEQLRSGGAAGAGDTGFAPDAA